MKSWTTIRIRNKAKIKSIALAAKKADFLPSLFGVMELFGQGKKEKGGRGIWQKKTITRRWV